MKKSIKILIALSIYIGLLKSFSLWNDYHDKQIRKSNKTRNGIVRLRYVDKNCQENKLLSVIISDSFGNTVTSTNIQLTKESSQGYYDSASHREYFCTYSYGFNDVSSLKESENYSLLFKTNNQAYNRVINSIKFDYLDVSPILFD
jgi:S-adenosylmethionine hydrolase